MSDKLKETFNMNDEGDDYLDELMNIEIPDDAELDDISRLALEAYREQMINLQHIDERFRARNLEICQQFLNLAKDAIAKNQELKLKREALEGKTKEPEKDEGAGISRQELLRQIEEERKANTK